MARAALTHVLGIDGLVHEAEVKMNADLEACTRIIALRRLGPGELKYFKRWCPRCFPKGPA